MIRLGTSADLAAASSVYRRASLSNEGDRDNLLAHPEFLILGPDGLAEGRVEAGKLAHRVRAWIDDLPARQREVVLLRDVEGMSSEEVCTVLSLTEGNQRVLLHRGRSRLRQLFEDEFREAR